ncbi:MAG: hypothetical protein ACI9MR_001531 [Myxococcota bacterium]
MAEGRSTLQRVGPWGFATGGRGEASLCKPMKVSGLVVYPVKSARGIVLNRAEVDRFGIRHDRRFMLVDPDGVFVTQREAPMLALAVPAFEGDEIVVRKPGGPLLRLSSSPVGPSVSVVVWGDRCEAVLVGKSESAWFSALLQRPVQLVYMPQKTRRIADQRYAPAESTVSFADGFPFLVTTEASLADLNDRIEARDPGSKALLMNRFRPNIIVDGAQPWSEDAWGVLQIGDLTLDVVKPCGRCSITTTDQETARRAKEPLRTLATFRRASDGEILFGQNAVHRGAGTLSLGDTVEVVGRIDRLRG